MYTKKIKGFLAFWMAGMILLSSVPMGAYAGTVDTEHIAIMTESPIDTALSEPDNTAVAEIDQSGVAEETESQEPPSDKATEALPLSEEQNEALPEEPPAPNDMENAMLANGHIYVQTTSPAKVYANAEMSGDARLFTISVNGAVLLATEYMRRETATCVRVWFLTLGGETLTGYIDVAALSVLTAEEITAMAATLSSARVLTEAGEMNVFAVEGDKAVADMPDEVALPQTPMQEPVMAEPTEHSTEAPVAVTDILPTDALTVEASEAPAMELPAAQIGDFLFVTPSTRVFSSVDETAADDYEGDLFLGVFVNEATVQLKAIEQDGLGRYWYCVRYLYGDDFADGTLKWTDTATVYVLARDTAETIEHDFTVTDYALASVPQTFLLRAASPMNGFSLKTIHAPIPSFSIGQGGVYGSSGKDSDYLQIAKSADHGTIYATPHYLDGFSVYCLEHNLSGPGENIAGGGQQPSGPYMIVDIDSYRNNPGYSSIIYHDSTLHAIAWVLRHSYPFMALDRSDSDNETWSRVAGQFAIRQVIRELEGAQYVRSYWDMDNFYRASGQAPAVYLEYARWLATNGIGRGNITGNISVSGKSVTAANGTYIGTVTLSTDADLMRIRKSVGSVTGYTAGSDGNYYYLNSGDTIAVAATSSSFSIMVESISSEDEEASFLVGVPSVEIQKVLIPQYGAPYKLKSVSVAFEVPLGSVAVTKRDAQSGAVLAGAAFELLSVTGSLLQTQTTGTNGIATFANVQPGVYLVREKSAPQGYAISIPNTQSVAVTAGTVSPVAFINDTLTAKIRIIKKDQLTKMPLAGVAFTVTRLTAPAGRNGVGEVVAVLTPSVDGTAETGWLDWGRYRVTETKVPSHFVDSHFLTEIDAYENGKTYLIEVENEPTKGLIRLTKTDRQTGNPIAGVRFDIYYNDEYGQGLAGTMVTDAEGTAISEALRKGRYTVKEHGKTAGYYFEEIVLEATVKSDETTELTATNLPVQVRLRLSKRDADEYDSGNPNALAVRGDGVLTGAVFQVLAGENIRDRQGNVMHEKGAVVVTTLTTAGEDASVTTDALWPGLYEIVEMTPPTGYQPSNRHFSVDTRSAAAQSTEAILTYEGLKTNAIMTGMYAIVKFLGDNEVHDDAGIIETPEPGAEFEFYLKSAGSYENARAFERDYLITNHSGFAKTKMVPYGLYVLKQVKGQAGYAIKSPMDIFIRGTEDPNDPPILTINNQAIRYRLKLIKVDAETGKTIALANTAFTLKDGDGNTVTQTVHYPNAAVIDTFYTDASGEVTLPETITYGMYYVQELVAPDGYLLLTEPLGVFVGDETMNQPGEAYLLTIEIPNQPVKGRIVLNKRGLQLTGFDALADAYGNEVHSPVYEERYLAGAVFEVRAAEAIVGKEGTLWYEKDELVDTITTTDAGGDVSKLLPLGNYYLIEAQSPAGYALSSTRRDVQLLYAGGQTAMVDAIISIGNDYLPAEIALRKEIERLQPTRDGDGTLRQILIPDAPGERFVFGLYNDKDIYYRDGTLMADSLVATGTTDANGSLVFSGHFPHGDYYLKELAAPVGWRLNPECFVITLDPSHTAEDANVIRISLPEAVHDELIYTSVTLTKTDITGEQTLPGATIEVKSEAGEVIYRACTDANGRLPDILVMPGKYTFREILAPEGYALNEAEMTFTVDEYGNVTGDTAIRDDYTRVSVRKQNEDGLPLAGVMFALLKADGSTAMTAVSSETGLVVFEKIPFGQYTIVETAPPTGYFRSEVKVELTVDGNFTNPTEPLATIVNHPNEIVLHKVDTEGKPLAGTVFALLNVNGEPLMLATTGADGMVHFTKIPYGQYILREMEAPAGFSRMDDMHLTVDANWSAPMEYTCVNIPDHYAFMKVDNRGNPLAGVKFALEDDAGNTLQELTSGKDGVVQVTELTKGAYIIRETEALEGFNKTEETIQLTIDEQYVSPAELYRFINYSGIQTGFEMAMTPVMWVGVSLMLTAGVSLVAYGAKHKGKRRRK